MGVVQYKTSYSYHPNFLPSLHRQHQRTCKVALNNVGIDRRQFHGSSFGDRLEVVVEEVTHHKQMSYLGH